MKIYIVGSVASGKSTLAKRLSEILHTPYYPLDEVVHTPDNSNSWGNRKRTIEERDMIFDSIMNQDKWIVEDVGRPCFEAALKDADKIILLEISTVVRNYRIIKRWLKQRLGIEQCIYNPTFKMLKWMMKWAKDYDTGKDGLKERISQFNEKSIKLKSNKDINTFLKRYL